MLFRSTNTLVTMLDPLVYKEQFDRIFPFHFLLDGELVIRRAGKSLHKLMSDIIDRPFTSSFTLHQPFLPKPTFENLVQIREPVILHSLNDSTIKFRGQLEFLEKENLLLFIGTPWFRNMEEVNAHGLTLDDFSKSDPMVDLLHALKTEEMVGTEAEEMLAKINLQKKEFETSDRKSTRLNSSHT